MKVRRDGQYSGRPLDGKKEWPMILRGTREIAAFLRWHPETVGKFLRDRRLPGCRDAKGVWFTTRTLIDRWILKQQATQDEAVTIGTTPILFDRCKVCNEPRKECREKRGNQHVRPAPPKIGPLDRKSGEGNTTEMKVDWNKVPPHIIQQAVEYVARKRLKDVGQAEAGLVSYMDEINEHERRKHHER